MKNQKPLIVQKFGGATLADSQRIKTIASQIAELAKTHRLIIAVSAMGQTTNELIELAHQVSSQPRRRELDMLLSVGERISMSLLSMALNDLGCPAISFTGSQAGILTDDSHVNAFIVDLKPIRVQQALEAGQVVIVAGFQGVSPVTKEITTLGRGGTDTTAVAMAAHFGAERCEILKDVAGVFTADPKIVPEARPLQNLNFESLLEMTFWGAKVLHYRSVELAQTKNISLYIGPAVDSKNANRHESFKRGTLVNKGLKMFESVKLLSLNSHEYVMRFLSKLNSAEMLKKFQEDCERAQIAFPQLLTIQTSAKAGFNSEILLCGPVEIMQDLEKAFANNTNFQFDQQKLSTVTITCSGSTSPQLSHSILVNLDKAQVKSESLLMSAMSATILLDRSQRTKALQSLHSLIH